MLSHKFITILRTTSVSQIKGNRPILVGYPLPITTTHLQLPPCQKTYQFLAEPNFAQFSTFTNSNFHHHHPYIRKDRGSTSGTVLSSLLSQESSAGGCFTTGNWKLLHTMTQRLMTNKESRHQKTAEKQNDGESTSSLPPPPPIPDQPLSRQAKLKQAIKDYGATVLVFHIGMSLCSLGMFYLLVSSGLDVVGAVRCILAHIGTGTGEKMLQSKVTEGATTFVVAYAVHKIFAPVRITITLTATPLIVKKLRRMGILKAPKPSPTIQK